MPQLPSRYLCFTNNLKKQIKMETTNNTISKTFGLGKLGCDTCARNVEKILKEKKGIIKASADFGTSSVAVEYNPDIISPEEMRTAIQDGGYDMYLDK